MKSNIELLERISRAFFNLSVDITITKYICVFGFIFTLKALDALHWSVWGSFIGLLLLGKFLKIRE